MTIGSTFEMASADILEFQDINSEVKGSLWQGRLKLTEQNIIFKNSKTGKVDQLSISDVDLVNWLKLVGQFGIRLFLKNGMLYRYIGFKEAEREKLANYFRNVYKMDFLEKELCLKGWNWGTAKFLGSVLSFDVNNTTAFEIPLNNVSQCTTGKNEVTLEYHQNDDAPVSLMEMRFHIPSSELAGDDPVDSFHSQVMKQASVISVSGDAIAIFREIHILTPRGRYDIKIFPTFFQLHGKTFDYKVPMSTVIRLFLLPHKDQRQHFLVVSLDPPIKQGQTRYHFLVLLFNQDEETSMELPFTEEEIKKKYEGKITKELSGPTYEVLAKIMKVLMTKGKITGPGSFIGHSGTAAISCSYKAAAGSIYPLDRGFIYIHKPPIHIRFEEISCVNFARGGGTNRSFDFEIELKNGVVNTFSNIEKEEYSKLFDFINAKKLRVKNRGKTDAAYTAEDFGDSDEEGNDAYLARVKREGKEKDIDDDDEDESTDEDFKPPAGDLSEVDDEYDSNAQTTDSESGSEGGEKKEKKSKPKKEKHKKASSESKPRKKKVKDKNRPKRPPSAYMLWFNDSREDIKTNNPGISFTDIAKKGGELWKKLGPKDKEIWEGKAKEAKEEYDKAMKEYIASGGSANAEKESSKKSDTKKSKSKPSASTGSGSGFKSKEYISDDTSSDSDAKSDKKSKAKQETKNDSSTDVQSDDSEDDRGKSKKAKRKTDSDNETTKKKKATNDVDDSSDDDRKTSKRKKEASSSSEEDKRNKKKRKEKSSDDEEEDEESAESTPDSDDDD